MLPSMFSLDHRLAELREAADQLRTEHQLRDAARAAGRPGRSLGEALGARFGARFGATPAPGRPTRLATR
jgi:hypothetical protein